MADSSFRGSRTLVIEVQDRACAVPLVHVIETMRPLPVTPVPGTPSFVRGVSIIRGVPTPVVDLAILLGATDSASNRFVTLRLGDRQVALSVDGVLGVRELDASMFPELPPLLCPQDAIETISTLDHQMLVVLRTSWQLPDEALHALALTKELR